MSGTGQLPFVLFIMLHKVALIFESDLWMNYCNATSQMKVAKYTFLWFRFLYCAR